MAARYPTNFSDSEMLASAVGRSSAASAGLSAFLQHQHSDRLPALIRFQQIVKARCAKKRLKRQYADRYERFLIAENSAFNALGGSSDDDEDRNSDSIGPIYCRPRDNNDTTDSTDVPYAFMLSHTYVDPMAEKREMEKQHAFARSALSQRETASRLDIEEEERYYRAQLQLEASVLPVERVQPSLHSREEEIKKENKWLHQHLSDLIRQEETAKRCDIIAESNKERHHIEREREDAWEKYASGKQRIFKWMLDDLLESEKACRFFIEREEANETWTLNEEAEHIQELLPSSLKSRNVGTQDRITEIFFTSETRMRSQMERVEEIERSELAAIIQEYHALCKQNTLILNQVESQEMAFRAQIMDDRREDHESLLDFHRGKVCIHLGNEEVYERIKIQRDEIAQRHSLNVTTAIAAHRTRKFDHLRAAEASERRFIEDLATSSLGFVRGNLFEQLLTGNNEMRRGESTYRLAIINEELEDRALLYRACASMAEIIGGYRDDVYRSNAVMRALGTDTLTPLHSTTSMPARSVETLHAISDVEMLARERIAMEQAVGVQLIKAKLHQAQQSVLSEEERLARYRIAKRSDDEVSALLAEAASRHQKVAERDALSAREDVAGRKPTARKSPGLIDTSPREDEIRRLSHARNSNGQYDPMDRSSSEGPTASSVASLPSHVRLMRDTIYECFALTPDTFYRMTVVDFIDSVLAVGSTANMDDFSAAGKPKQGPSSSPANRASLMVWSDKELYNTIAENMSVYSPLMRRKYDPASPASPLIERSAGSAYWLHLEECCALLCEGLGQVHKRLFPNSDVKSPELIHSWSYQYINYGLHRLLKDQAMSYVTVFRSTFDLLSTGDRRMPFSIFSVLFLKQLTSRTRSESIKRRTNIDYTSRYMMEDGIPYLAFSSFLHSADTTLLGLQRTIEPLLLPDNTVGLHVAGKNPFTTIPLSFVIRGADCIAAVAGAHSHFVRILEKTEKAIRPRNIFKSEEDDAEAKLAVSASAADCFSSILENTSEDILQKLTTKCLLLLVLYSTWLECDDETDAAKESAPINNDASTSSSAAANASVDRYWTRKVFHEANAYYLVLSKNKTNDVPAEKKKERLVRVCNRIVSLFYDFFLNLRSRPVNINAYMERKIVPESSDLTTLKDKALEFRNISSPLGVNATTAVGDDIPYTEVPGGPEMFISIITMLSKSLGVVWMNYAGDIDGVVTYYSQHYFADSAVLDASLFRKNGCNRRNKVAQYYKVYDEVTRHVKNFNDLMDGSMVYLQKVWAGSRWLRSNIASNTGVPGLPPPIIPESFLKCSRQLAFCMVSVWPHQRKERLPFKLIVKDASSAAQNDSPNKSPETSMLGASETHKAFLVVASEPATARSVNSLFSALDMTRPKGMPVDATPFVAPPKSLNANGTPRGMRQLSKQHAATANTSPPAVHK